MNFAYLKCNNLKKYYHSSLDHHRRTPCFLKKLFYHYYKTYEHVITINVPLFKKLRDIIFFCGTITLWAISRVILRGPRLFWPLKLSRAQRRGQKRYQSTPLALVFLGFIHQPLQRSFSLKFFSLFQTKNPYRRQFQNTKSKTDVFFLLVSRFWLDLTLILAAI